MNNVEVVMVFYIIIEVNYCRNFWITMCHNNTKPESTITLPLKSTWSFKNGLVEQIEDKIPENLFQR